MEDTDSADHTAGVTPGGDGNGFDPFVLEQSHPFYFHPAENPGQHLVAVPFSGTGFNIWKRNMMVALSAKNKLGILNGRVPVPEPNSPYFPYWERCNDMIIAWLTSAVSREISVSIIGFETAKEIWEDLNERFGKSNGNKYIQIQKELSHTIQGTSDFATYYTKLKGLWDDLGSSYVGPTCSCGALPKFLEQQKLLQFLGGLNESYATVKSSLLMMTPLPSLSKAYNILINDETQREGYQSSSFQMDSIAFAAQNLTTHPVANRPSGSNNKPSQQFNFTNQKSVGTVYCRYCKKPNHTIENCYKL